MGSCRRRRQRSILLEGPDRSDVERDKPDTWTSSPKICKLPCILEVTVLPTRENYCLKGIPPDAFR